MEDIEFFFELLKNENLSSSNIEDEIYKWNSNKFSNFIEYCSELLPTTKKSASSTFEFIANSQLSGYPEPCGDIQCRLSNVDTMARFACLYADRVLIHNPFEDYHLRNTDTEENRKRLVNDLYVIYRIKPLLETRLVEFVETPSSRFHFCRECYEDIIAQKPDFGGKSLLSFKKILKNKYLKEADFFVEYYRGVPVILKEDITDYIDDNACLKFIENLEPNIERKLEKFESIKLSKKDLLRLGIIDDYVHPIINDIAVQNWCANIYGTNYVTNRMMDFELISSDPELEIYNKKLLNNFSHYVPIISDTTLSKLVKFRQEEGEAFLVYRDALSSALKNAISSRSNEFNQIFNDIVQPEINKINLSVKKSRHLLWNSLFSDMILSSGFISIGMFSGILPHDVSQIVTALGGFKFISTMKDKLGDLVSEQADITANKFYFLWKMKSKL
jgi:hypothetical protein